MNNKVEKIDYQYYIYYSQKIFKKVVKLFG